MTTSPTHLRLTHPPHEEVTAPRAAPQQWSPRKRVDFLMLVTMPVATLVLLRSCTWESATGLLAMNALWFLQTFYDFRNRR